VRTFETGEDFFPFMMICGKDFTQNQDMISARQFLMQRTFEVDCGLGNQKALGSAAGLGLDSARFDFTFFIPVNRTEIIEMFFEFFIGEGQNEFFGIADKLKGVLPMGVNLIAWKRQYQK
jgi:hypothetical protein